MSMEYKDGLKSARLTTRFVTKNDAWIWLDYCNDPVATKFTGIADKTPAELAEFFMDRTLLRYAEGRLGLQALINKETGAFVGQCGLIVQEVDGVKEIEIGYHLLPKYWGQGYASEAARMFRDYGFENYTVDSIVSLIAPGNHASEKVALQNGMQKEREALFHEKPINIFRITREDWQRLKI